MQFKSILLLASSIGLVCASPLADPKPKPTLTTETNVYTGTRVFDSIDTNNWSWETVTETFLWTQTVTATVTPTAA
ncbi:hypothetical protein CPC08DRAFT_706007 [Agrocybe pediades]|nr:hypothetical protein CPC08DRAFT_706007 [Agrocybe pediades]